MDGQAEIQGKAQSLCAESNHPSMVQMLASMSSNGPSIQCLILPLEVLGMGVVAWRPFALVAYVMDRTSLSAGITNA